MVNKFKEPGVTAIKEEVLEIYPAKVARKRAKHMQEADPNPETMPEIAANVRTIPGIITQRGCCYAGCKGVVIGPFRDILSITHGPIGCGFYSWLTRRNLTKPEKETDDNFMTYCLSTDMQEDDIVFGGEKKLKQAIKEAYEIFKPQAIAIHATCPVGLIGDDVHAVAREMKEALGINVFGFSCEGYKGVSQSAGHHIANNQLLKSVIGNKDESIKGPYSINMLGEYNIGGDAFVLEELLERCGITLNTTFSGNGTYEGIEKAHNVQLNVVMCHRSINYIADMIEKKYGVPWIKVNFIGAEATAKSLRKIAAYFEDPQLTERVEKVIAEEMVAVIKTRDQIRQRCQGKKVMLFVGGSRAHHYQELFKEIGMKVTAAGYEFAHRDDYEGRRVIPKIKIDADSRNIEELCVEPDPEKYQPRKTPEEMARLEASGFEFRDYEGMITDMEQGTMVVDDISHYETEKLIEVYQPDLFCAGIKEKFAIEKMGVPSKQLHSYDYGGPYAGFEGAINFYKEVDRLVNSQIFKKIKAPWQKNPEIMATYGA